MYISIPGFAHSPNVHQNQTDRAQSFATQQAIEQLEPELLQKGDRNTSVQTLQTVLQALSFYTSTIDGYFGEETVNAVEQLQEKMELEVTGLFDLETWYALTFWSGALM